MAEKVIVNGYKAIVSANAKAVIAEALDLGGDTPTLVTASVTPTVSAQTITPEEGEAFNKIEVEAVTSAIDANITAENIKKDVVILGVTGSYEAPTPTVSDGEQQ